MFPLDRKVRGLCEGLVRWWGTDDPERRLGMQSAHDLAGLVLVAQGLLDLDDLWRKNQSPNSQNS
jgi:hypothetical protein